MFEHLDKVDWASMNHAYGSAADVPDLIRELASDDPAIREEAFSAAYGNIFHQGSRYEATAPTLPFLLEILAQPDYPDTEELLYLIAALVMGFDSAYLPYGFSYEIEGMRAELAELGARPAAERAQDERDELGWGTDEDWLGWMVAITDQARKGVPRYIRLLGADDPHVRVAAAYVLSWLPEDVEMFGPALWEAVQGDESDMVRANALIALALASDDDSFAEYAKQVEGMMADGEPIVQFAAAIALCTRCPDDAPDAAVQILLDAVSQAGEDEEDSEELASEDDPASLASLSLSDEDNDEMMFEATAFGEERQIAWCNGDTASYASDVLAVACADNPMRVVNAISASLPGMRTLQASNAAGTVLSLLFPEGFEGDDGAQLAKLQREFLEVLAEVRAPWFLGDAQFGNFSLTMSDFGLPGSMDALRKFLS